MMIPLPPPTRMFSRVCFPDPDQPREMNAHQSLKWYLYEFLSSHPFFFSCASLLTALEFGRRFRHFSGEGGSTQRATAAVARGEIREELLLGGGEGRQGRCSERPGGGGGEPGGSANPLEAGAGLPGGWTVGLIGPTNPNTMSRETMTGGKHGCTSITSPKDFVNKKVLFLGLLGNSRSCRFPPLNRDLREQTWAMGHPE